MAIKFRADRKLWYVEWVDPTTAKRVRRFTSTKAEAKELNKYIEAIKDPLKLHELALVKTERKSQNTSCNTLPNSLRAINQAYLDERQYKPKGLTTHNDGMKLALDMFGDKRIEKITREDLGVLYSTLTKMHAKNPRTGKDTDRFLKAVSIHSRMDIVFRVFRWAHKRGLLAQLPAFPDIPRGVYEKFIPPTNEELSALYSVAPEHLKRVLVVGSQLGVRDGESELLRIKWSDFTLRDEGTSFLRLQAAAKNPNEPWREIPIKSNLVPLFKEWQAKDQEAGIEHLIHWRGKPIQKLRTSWKNALKKAGITHRLRVYDLRHMFATSLLAAGAEAGTVAHLMGHSSTAMVYKTYQHVLTTQKVAAIESLPDIPTFTNEGRGSRTKKGSVIKKHTQSACNQVCNQPCNQGKKRGLRTSHHTA